VARLHAENYGVYGRRKMHALLRRQGWAVGRDQTERLMRLAGVRGVKRSKRVFTTKPDPQLSKPKDLVQRYIADAPRRLWVSDVERHEALLNLAVVKGHRFAPVAAGV
jgi:putative transposase